MSRALAAAEQPGMASAQLLPCSVHGEATRSRGRRLCAWLTWRCSHDQSFLKLQCLTDAMRGYYWMLRLIFSRAICCEHDLSDDQAFIVVSTFLAQVVFNARVIQLLPSRCIYHAMFPRTCYNNMYTMVTAPHAQQCKNSTTLKMIQSSTSSLNSQDNWACPMQ